ncbi:FIP1[V]-like protein isoform X2 [Iris pallida]|uniref:FIP1[V]-like protein isoform X2 n=1 Tax=Iris pallida TaxID=29817 RepID=A0AAX6FBS6_IRIPA|nr:FIP1[V]-like protein isoform X2 [Iris pallida]
MDDDDDFGDLYTDIIPSVSVTSASPLPGGDGIPIGNPSSHLPPPETLIQDPNDDWLPENWNDDDDVVVAAATAPADFVTAAATEDVRESRVFEPEGSFGVLELEIGADRVIPGLSSSSAPVPAPAEPKASNSEEWDSESDDDLQIVLNDAGDDQMMMTEEDEGGEELGLQHRAMEEQDWGEGEPPMGAAAAAEGEKEGQEAAKVSCAAGSAVAATTTRVGYGAHGFNQQHHSMYKYVRPGAPVVGSMGPPGQIRPPPLGAIAGRGRGDWRPPGIRGISNAQKGFMSGYSVPTWGNSSSGRAFGGGLDFTLPSHKTVFDVDIESFEEKPWRHPGVDITDYFNFGLNEDGWKDYSKQLDQLRLGSTMQSRIRVYEGGRPEQDYDPDLPPELAAAAGHHDISVDNYGKIENGQVDPSGQGRGAPCSRPPLPIGRAIQVETGNGERLPSIDTRPPRTRDTDAIIEIVLQDSMYDSAIYNAGVEQAEKNIQGEQLKRISDIEGDKRGGSEYPDQFPQNINGRKKEMVNRRVPFALEGDGILPFPPESPLQYHPNSRLRSPLNPSGSVGTRHGGRLGQGASCGRCSSTSGDNSNDAIGSRSTQVKNHDSHKKEKTEDSKEGNGTPEASTDIAVETAGDQSIEHKEDGHDDRLALGGNVDVEGEETSDFQISGKISHGGSIIHSSRKHKLCSRVEQPVIQENVDGEDLRATYSDNSRAKSGSSKECQKRYDNGEEVVQEGLSRRARDLRGSQEEEHMTRGREDYGREGRRDMDRNRTSKGREGIHNPCRDRESNSAHLPRGRSEGFERPKESDNLFRQRREDDIHRRSKDEDLRRERIDETGLRNRSKVRSDRNDKDDGIHTMKRLDDGDWRGRPREGGPRQRERDDGLSSRRENLDEHPVNRKKDDDHSRRERVDREDSLPGYRAREDSSRRKRERDDSADRRRREETSRLRGKPDDHHTSKHRDESWRHREREDGQQLKLPHDESLTQREREDGRGVTRGGRSIEDKPLGGNGRNKSNSKGIVSDTEYLHRDKRRHAEQSKKGDHAGDENSLHKARDEAHAREKHYNNEERSSRHERLSIHRDRPTSASDNHHMSKERFRESTRKSKDSEGIGPNSQGLGKRKHEDRNTQPYEKVKSKGTIEQESENPSVSKKSRQLAHSSERHGENIASDDENQEESRKGRSKLERWTSHKERDFSATAMLPSLSSKVVEVESTDNAVVATDVLPKIEGNIASDPDPKSADEGEITENLGDDQDRHLDTVEKLKKRSERFKLPMPGEKDTIVGKKPENEVQLIQQTESVADTEVKPERPARKRRWTGS